MTTQDLVLKLASKVSPLVLGSSQKFNGSDATAEITAATNASPIVITVAGLNLSQGDYVYIKNAVGNTAVNNTLANPAWQVTPLGSNQYELDGSAGDGVYTGGGVLIPALIGTVDGVTHSALNLISYVNQARFALVKAAVEAGIEIQGSILYIERVFTAEGTAVSIARPDGFVDFISLLDRTSPPQPIHFRKGEALLSVRSSTSGQHEAESATQRYLFEKGDKFVHYGGFVTAGAVADLQYYGATDITRQQVIEGTATEQLFEWTILLELAVAIANGAGSLAANEFAKRLLKVT